MSRKKSQSLVKLVEDFFMLQNENEKHEIVFHALCWMRFHYDYNFVEHHFYLEWNFESESEQLLVNK